MTPARRVGAITVGISCRPTEAAVSFLFSQKGFEMARMTIKNNTVPPGVYNREFDNVEKTTHEQYSPGLIWTTQKGERVRNEWAAIRSTAESTVAKLGDAFGITPCALQRLKIEVGGAPAPTGKDKFLGVVG